MGGAFRKFRVLSGSADMDMDPCGSTQHLLSLSLSLCHRLHQAEEELKVVNASPSKRYRS